MRRISLLGLLFLGSVSAGAPLAAQNAIDDYRESIMVRGNVFLSLTGGHRPAYYREDGPPEMPDKHPLGGKVSFLVTQQRGLNLMLGFVNPIRHAFAASEVVVGEPNYAAANKLAESFSSLTSTLNVSASLQNAVASVSQPPTTVPLSSNLTTGIPIPAQAFGDITAFATKSVAKLDPAKFPFLFRNLGAKSPTDSAKKSEQDRLKVAVESLSFPQAYSPDLVLWTLLSTDSARFSCLSVKPDVSQRLLNAAGDADAFIYTGSGSPSDSKRPAMTYRRIATQIPSGLLVPDDLASFRTSLVAAGRARDSLEKIDRDADAAIKAYVTAAEAFADTFDDKSAPGCRNFAAYTKSVVGMFETSTRTLLNQRTAARTAIAQTITDLTNYVRDNGTRDELNAFRLATVEVPAGEMKDVSIVVQRRIVDSTGGRLTLRNDTADTLLVRIRRKQTFVAELAPGVAFLSSVAYPRFGTSQAGGQTIVQQGDADVQRTTVIGMLNLLTPQVLGPVVPGIQIGIGSGRDYPLLLGGGVLRFLSASQFAVSAGVALPWYRELKTLRVGDVVKGTADIDSDIRFRVGTASFYVGLQKGF